MDGWNTTFLLGRPIFRGYVSFREGTVDGSEIRNNHLDVKFPVKNGINYLSTGAGFLPSTVCHTCLGDSVSEFAHIW